MNRALTLTLAALLAAAPAGWAKSAKRGAGWDEHNLGLNAAHAAQMAPGVSWAYNWGPDAANHDAYSEDFAFAPMAWNGSFSEQRIRAWVAAHPETRYLLAFNEPNFADQARMTPADAAKAWPILEKIAADCGLRLVAPALNFSASQVGGRVWNPYEWYDEFFRLVPDAAIDCLAMHCYMNWYSAQTWLATEYFYADLYNPRKDCYGRYPNLVAFLDRFKAERGHFPRMMLTEFCAWENDGTITGPDFQIDQMTQKVQMLEQSDLVEGYAWFMANADAGSAAYPYMSLFTRNTADAALSDLGKVYVHMSDFDKTRYHNADAEIAASDYVDATLDDNMVKVRPNSEAGSDLPLQIEIPAGGYPTYQIDAEADGAHTFTFHVCAQNATTLAVYVDSKKASETAVASTGAGWADVAAAVPLAAGRHAIMLYNAGTAPVKVNSLSFAAPQASVADLAADADAPAGRLFDLAGRPCDPESAAPGLYILCNAAGKYSKILK